MKPCLLLLVLAVPAAAQVAEFSLSGGQSRLSNRDIGALSTASKRSDELQLTDGFRIGFRMTLNNWRFFGHEMGYAYNRTNLRLNVAPAEEYGTAIHQGFYNFLAYALPEGSTVRPFAAGGGHFSNFMFPGYSVTSGGGGSNKFGFNYGGGLKIRVSPMFAVRFDFRQYVTGKPFDFPNQSGKLRQTELSAGFAVVM